MRKRYTADCGEQLSVIFYRERVYTQKHYHQIINTPLVPTTYEIIPIEYLRPDLIVFDLADTDMTSNSDASQ